MSTDNKFFDESLEQSLIKAEIVSKYFWAWAKVILPTAKRNRSNIAYIDLFAGPGRFKDGKSSTPLLILEQAIQDGDMREYLVTIFNDKSEENTSELLKAIQSMPGIDNLKHQPMVNTSQVGDEIVKMFEGMRLIPTLFFVDPWGYKGLSLNLIGSVLQNWGCDCIFFFNYNRINMGLGNSGVKKHMDVLFGELRANELRVRLETLSPEEREVEIIETLSVSLRDYGGNYVLPFTFKRATGERTSHHLIFVTKHVRGYEIMKSIMAKMSSDAPQGVPSFMYSPATTNQPFLFELNTPLEALCDMLTEEFRGKELSMVQVYDRHHVGKPYIKPNYKHALNQLESEGKILANPPAQDRPKRKGEVTFADRTMVTFLEK